MSISGQLLSTEHGPSMAGGSSGRVTQCWLSRSTLCVGKGVFVGHG